MDEYLVFLRFLHIGTGAFWTGTAIYLAAFVLPASKALGPDGGRMMQQISKTNNFPVVMAVNSTLTVLSGFLLMWYFSDGFTNNWMGTRMGMVLSTGGALAFIAWLIGFIYTRPRVARMAKMGQAAAEKQQLPTPEEMQLMGTLSRQVAGATRLIAWLMVITVTLMAVARYI